MEKITEKEIRKEIGKWFLDISKYTATAALISTFLGDFSQRWLLYTAGILVVAVTFLLGVMILKHNKK